MKSQYRQAGNFEDSMVRIVHSMYLKVDSVHGHQPQGQATHQARQDHQTYRDQYIHEAQLWCDLVGCQKL